jgi:hypothetical protein
MYKSNSDNENIIRLLLYGGINVLKVNKNHTELIARLLTNCFINDPLVIMETKGIDNKKLFLENLFIIQLPIFEKTIDVLSLDDNYNSVVIGYEKKK